MTIATIARRTKQLASDHSPTILTVAGITGTVVTALLAGRAGYKAGYRVAEDDLGSSIPKKADVSKKDRAKHVSKLTWKLYISPAVTGVGTITSIAVANRIGVNRTAALAAAYTITDRAFVEYKDKVKETLGEKKEQTEIQDKIMEDRVRERGDASGLVMISGNDVLCYDAFTDRFFMSSMEALKKAQNDTNYEIINNLYVSLSEFYSKIGLAPTSYSDEVGWNTDNLMELHFSSVMTPDDRPALAFNFHVDPVRNYSKLNR